MASPEQPLWSLFTVTTPILYRGSGHATGFFFRYKNNTFLITNRHVVDITSVNGEALKQIRICTRPDNTDLTNLKHHDLHLIAEDNEENRWFCPENSSVDVAVIPLSPPIVNTTIDIPPIGSKSDNTGTRALTTDQIPHQSYDKSNKGKSTLLGGSQAMILGYPVRASSPYFPIARSALISTPYGHPNKKLPSFLIDAKTHNGLSGSPVFLTSGGLWSASSSTELFDTDNVGYIGIHSEKADTDVAEPLDLNRAWYPEVVLETIDGV